MKILFVNWAPLWRGAQAGGGVNVYVQAMSSELAKRGHQVYAVNAGFSYDLLLWPRIRHVRNYQQVACYEILNSPVIAPGFFNLHRPQSDVQNTVIETLFQRLLKRLQPDVVHFNNIEGFSGQCIALARQFGARVIYSLHNYHPLCNQVNLLYQNRTVCNDFNAGQKCTTCLPQPAAPWRQHWRRRLIYYVRDLPYLKRWYNRVAPVAPDVAGRSALPAQCFQQRRTDLIQCLNQADQLLAVSSWVRDKFVQYGLDANKTKVNTIGSAIASRPTPAASARTVLPSLPVRLVFMGVAEPHKGLPLLLRALALLDDSQLKQLDLALYARGVHSLAASWQPLQQKLAVLTVQDGYQYEAIPDLLADRHLGIVAPIWWDNAPQVVFELLALQVPVLGARIGGIPDFVSDDHNGRLFAPDDAADLATKLCQIIESPQRINVWRHNIRPMKTLAQHADELENIYADRRH